MNMHENSGISVENGRHGLGQKFLEQRTDRVRWIIGALTGGNAKLKQKMLADTGQQELLVKMSGVRSYNAQEIGALREIFDFSDGFLEGREDMFGNALNGGEPVPAFFRNGDKNAGMRLKGLLRQSQLHGSEAEILQRHTLGAVGSHSEAEDILEGKKALGYMALKHLLDKLGEQDEEIDVRKLVGVAKPLTGEALQSPIPMRQPRGKKAYRPPSLMADAGLAVTPPTPAPAPVADLQPVVAEPVADSSDIKEETVASAEQDSSALPEAAAEDDPVLRDLLAFVKANKRPFGSYAKLVVLEERHLSASGWNKTLMAEGFATSTSTAANLLAGTGAWDIDRVRSFTGYTKISATEMLTGAQAYLSPQAAEDPKHEPKTAEDDAEATTADTVQPVEAAPVDTAEPEATPDAATAATEQPAHAEATTEDAVQPVEAAPADTAEPEAMPDAAAAPMEQPVTAVTQDPALAEVVAYAEGNRVTFGSFGTTLFQPRQVVPNHFSKALKRAGLTKSNAMGHKLLIGKAPWDEQRMEIFLTLVGREAAEVLAEAKAHAALTAAVTVETPSAPSGSSYEALKGALEEKAKPAPIPVRSMDDIGPATLEAQMAEMVKRLVDMPPDVALGEKLRRYGAAIAALTGNC